MNESSQHNQQSESEVKEICIYQNMKVAVTASISGNKQWVSWQKNPKRQYLKVVTFSDPSSSKTWIYVCDYEA